MVQIDGQWEVLSITERRFARIWLLGYLVTIKNEHEETLAMKVPKMFTTVWTKGFDDFLDFMIRRELSAIKKAQNLKTKPVSKSDYRQSVGLKIEYDPTISDWLAH